MATTAQDREKALAQQAAEVLWAIATSNDNEIACYDSPAYTGAEQVFKSLVAHAYKLSESEVERVRDLLADLGPNDGVYSYEGQGVRNFVLAVLDGLDH